MEWTHEGTTITINHEGRFQLPGEQHGYASLREAQDAITASHKAERHAIDRTLNLQLLDRTGTVVTLRRIHEGTGDWLTEPKGVGNPYYLNDPKVAELLKEARHLDAEAKRIQAVADNARIAYRKGYGRQDAAGVDQVTADTIQGVEDAKAKWAAAQQTQ